MRRREIKKRIANNKFTPTLSQSRVPLAFQSCTFAQVPNLSPLLTSATRCGMLKGGKPTMGVTNENL
jgi:hypothetical protein